MAKKVVAKKVVKKGPKIQKEVAQNEVFGMPIDFDFKLENGKVHMSVSYEGAGIKSVLTNEINPDVFIDKLALAIPGKVDDKIFNALKLLLMR